MTGPLWVLLLKGAWITVQLMLYSAALAAAVAFGIGLARTSRLWIVRFLSGVYVEFFRGTSALVLMFWLFFALPLLGWQLAGLWAGTLALGLSYGAYGSEVVRGALQSVPAAQREAAVALSFSPWQRLRKVILPQAVPEMMPPFNNLLIELLKGTALASLLSIGELTFEAKLARLSTGESAQVYGIILVMYFVIAFVVTRVMRLLERRAKASVGQASLAGGGHR
ncbi:MULTISPECIES: ectoine/hydroxyectoine ABC transporter permease subunit EhuC [Streptomyces]|uniref:Ectoine/hydroxyectoine ABC transporter permease subunit EhuC n=1 Tax=Streptomyces doudnae TaxID=3075536 RepID=A0ABD5EMU4_9ACTN|nr:MULTISPECIES: ectoine/hydroxyectoine ABC transporter permease subunit EhuC [unclassified Streptomyces]MDT0435921.1 ectoine/hydroxyectoine ABC transporter permease subunit EhuC [Streptomyces sp. DSM 41981]MYQ64203.1 ectoine/hydroxyectoine ABC transporter permease subunit EhuC [Streptomyces sp. SID4950]SCD73928.1 amino acid ABC transporter membrane protein 1, PAAT family [Streptomyces sp. SolWspMP-5a-2]